VLTTGQAVTITGQKLGWVGQAVVVPLGHWVWTLLHDVTTAGHTVVVAAQLVETDGVQSVGVAGQLVMRVVQDVGSAGSKVKMQFGVTGQKVLCCGQTVITAVQRVGSQGQRVKLRGQKVSRTGHCVKTFGHTVYSQMVGFESGHCVVTGAQNVGLAGKIVTCGGAGHMTPLNGHVVCPTGQFVKLHVVGRLGQRVTNAGQTDCCGWQSVGAGGQVVIVCGQTVG
jgi:hypothetical protein